MNARVVNGEGAPHRLLQPTYVTCTCYRSLDSRSARPTFAVRTRPTEFPPPDTPGRFAFDDATRASVDPSLTRSAIWRSRAPLNPGGLRYRRALEGAPPVPRRCLPRARSARRPLTPPVATSSGPLDPPLAARTALPQGPVKGPASARSEAPSIDECPLDAPPPFRRTTNLEREPATGLGALPPVNPASDAPSPPRSGEEMARPRPLPRALHARALLATRRSSTSAIETICKHDLRTSKPGDASTDRVAVRLVTRCRSTFAELLVLRNRSSFRLGHRRFYTTMIQSKGSRGFTGQGPFGCIAIDDCFAGLLRDDGSSWRLRPNPIGSNTSCRATRVDYDRSTVIESSSAPAKPGRTSSPGSPPETPLAQWLPRRAASRTPSRKGDAFRRTRGAFHRKTSPCGECPFPTACTQPVEMMGPRLFYLRA